jgi:hypothetical protein
MWNTQPLLPAGEGWACTEPVEVMREIPSRRTIYLNNPLLPHLNPLPLGEDF